MDFHIVGQSSIARECRGGGGGGGGGGGEEVGSKMNTCGVHSGG